VNADERLAGLTRTVDQQRRTIEALIAAAERRTAAEPDSAALATWQRNLTLQRRVAERNDRVRIAEQLLRSVIDSLDVGLCILAADGTILDTNTVWQQMLGAGGAEGSFFELDRLPAVGLGELLREAAGSVHDLLAGRATDAGTEHSVVIGDDPRWWKAGVDRVHGHDAAQAVVTLTDMTRYVRTREDLRQATKDASRLALVARHMDDSVVVTDEHGVIEWVNDAFTAMTGFTPVEAVGRERTDLVETDQPFPGLDEVTSADGEVMLPEVLTQTKDGRPYWLRAERFRVVDDDGVVRMVRVERDVTAQRDAEQSLIQAMDHSEALARELSTEKAVLTGVISSVPHLTYWKDSAGRYHGHNAAFLAMRGVEPGGTLLGLTEQDLDLQDDFGGTLLGLEERVLQTGLAVVDQQINITRTDGTTRTVLMSMLPQPPDVEGRLGGLIGVGADVTRVSELERQLNQTNRLEAIGQLAAGIAHEINTPIQFVSDNHRFVAQSLTQLLAVVEQVSKACAPGALDDPGRVVADLVRQLAEVDVDFLGEEIPAALTESREGLAARST
jgi:two-component system NtrC family sensor kinase